MSFSDSRRTAGIYDDPHLKALALEAAASERPISPLDLFGFAPMAPQQPAMPPVLLQLAQLLRDRVDAESLPRPRGNVPGTDVPDIGVPEDATEYLGHPPKTLDTGIGARMPQSSIDPRMRILRPPEPIDEIVRMPPPMFRVSF